MRYTLGTISEAIPEVTTYVIGAYGVITKMDEKQPTNDMLYVKEAEKSSFFIHFSESEMITPEQLQIIETLWYDAIRDTVPIEDYIGDFVVSFTLIPNRDALALEEDFEKIKNAAETINSKFFYNKTDVADAAEKDVDDDGHNETIAFATRDHKHALPVHYGETIKVKEGGKIKKGGYVNCIFITEGKFEVGKNAFFKDCEFRWA